MLHQTKRSKASASDEWWTPQDLFYELIEYYSFKPEIDVCATPANSLRNLYFTKKDNALTRDWKIGKKKRKCWMNPPNSKMKYFIAKAYQQWNDLGIQTMMILPLNVQSSCSWWDNVQEPIERGEKIRVRPIKGRRKFTYIKQDKGSSINGYCVVIFGRRNRC